MEGMQLAYIASRVFDYIASYSILLVLCLKSGTGLLKEVDYRIDSTKAI